MLQAWKQGHPITTPLGTVHCPRGRVRQHHGMIHTHLMQAQGPGAVLAAAERHVPAYVSVSSALRHFWNALSVLVPCILYAR
jgi:hypothetical protein